MKDRPSHEHPGLLPVVVVGASGRMGRHAVGLLNESDGFRVVARLGRGECTTARLASCGAHLGLDLTAAGLGAEHGALMLEAGLRPVIGTSGVSIEQGNGLDAMARELELGGLVVPNFSLGVWLQQRAAEEASRYFLQAEIIERHGPHKIDAPSGTALDTAERIAQARGSDSASEVPIHSLRLPGVLSNQEVAFGGRGEVLRLVHETYDQSCFSAGILSALRYASTAQGVGRGIGLAFESLGFPNHS
jgi:4-hydroxy-tetrahydrodipicolinate reductase